MSPREDLSAAAADVSKGQARSPAPAGVKRAPCERRGAAADGERQRAAQGRGRTNSEHRRKPRGAADGGRVTRLRSAAPCCRCKAERGMRDRAPLKGAAIFGAQPRPDREQRERAGTRSTRRVPKAAARPCTWRRGMRGPAAERPRTRRKGAGAGEHQQGGPAAAALPRKHRERAGKGRSPWPAAAVRGRNPPKKQHVHALQGEAPKRVY